MVLLITHIYMFWLRNKKKKNLSSLIERPVTLISPLNNNVTLPHLLQEPTNLGFMLFDQACISSQFLKYSIYFRNKL